jgi:hypothetical protein
MKYLMTFMTTNLVMGVVIFAMFWHNATIKRSNSNQGEQQQHKATQG